MGATTDYRHQEQLAVDLKTLMGMIGAGRTAASKLAEAAGARFMIGGRVLYNVKKIQAYMDQISE